MEARRAETRPVEGRYAVRQPGPKGPPSPKRDRRDRPGVTARAARGNRCDGRAQDGSYVTGGDRLKVQDRPGDPASSERLQLPPLAPWVHSARKIPIPAPNPLREQQADDPPPVPTEASGASRARGGNLGRLGHGTGWRSGEKGLGDGDRDVEDGAGR